jgi:putative nucleotidyltransferase with HDIG domain
MNPTGGPFQKLVRQVHSLPTLPTILLKITELVNNPKTSAIQLGRVIAEDPVLTAKLLKIVNSPFYGFPRKISTVTEAIAIIGFNALKNLVLTASVVDLFAGRKGGNGFEPRLLWDHSIAVASAAGLLGKAIGYEEREELFVGGLIHDLGKIIEHQFLRAEFEAAVQQARAGGGFLVDAEQAVLGFTHAEAGRFLGEQWKLPPRLVEVLAFHHQPAEAKTAPREAAVIHVADILARALGLGSGGDDLVPSLDPAAWERVGLPKEALDLLTLEMEIQVQETLALLSPVGSGGAPERARPLAASGAGRR